MKIVDRGSGTPVVLIPGIQGRWEWMRPAVDALSRRCRVITFSLADEPTAQAGRIGTDLLDAYVQQVGDAMDQAGLDRAVIAGVSFGGRIATAFASAHPDRTAGLVLVSAMPPGWVPDARVRFYIAAPRLLAPLFCVQSLRLLDEFFSAAGSVPRGLLLAARHGWTTFVHPMSPGRMARRALAAAQRAGDRPVRAPGLPALLVTGQADLDRVVPVRMTRQYLTYYPGARTVELPRTGHLGLVTRPDAFADILVPFVESAWHAASQRRHVV